MGVPSSGAADGLSLALANRLVGNALEACGLEVTLTGISMEFDGDAHIAVTGAPCEIRLNDQTQLSHRMLRVSAADTLTLSPASSGCRSYIAVAGGLDGEDWLGSSSTYMPAGLGGHSGRALKAGDIIRIMPVDLPFAQIVQTPDELCPHIGRSWLLRTVTGPEFDLLDSTSQTVMFRDTFMLSQRLNRMGAELEGSVLKIEETGRMPSTAMFPGTLQCPPGGRPFLLMVDGGVTGGYPRIAHVIRADRHMLGQLRPGDRVQFVKVNIAHANGVLRAKTELLRSWLGDTFDLW